MRLIELPRLVYQGATMADGVDIIDLVTGTVGDAGADSLQLTLQIDGVTDDTKSQFQVRYRVDDKDVSGSYNLNSATLVDGYEYRYEVVHDVALGFPLAGGEVPIEVIVDLPEGGDSRFSVDTFLAACSFDALLTGDVGSVFVGPAGFEYKQDGSLEIRLRSLGSLRGRDGSVYYAGGVSAPGIAMVPGSYPLVRGAVTNADPGTPGWTGQYFEGQVGYDCPTCGGSITVDTVDGIEMISIEASFVAAQGNETSPSSPYLRCRIPYEAD